MLKFDLRAQKNEEKKVLLGGINIPIKAGRKEEGAIVAGHLIRDERLIPSPKNSVPSLKFH